MFAYLVAEFHSQKYLGRFLLYFTQLENKEEIKEKEF